MNVHTPYAYQVPVEARKVHLISWDWRYKQLCTTMWVLGSASTEAAMLLIIKSSISPALNVCLLNSCHLLLSHDIHLKASVFNCSWFVKFLFSYHIYHIIACNVACIMPCPIARKTVDTTIGLRSFAHLITFANA